MQEFLFESTLFAHKWCPLAKLFYPNAVAEKTGREWFWDLQGLHEDLVLVKISFSIIENNDKRFVWKFLALLSLELEIFSERSLLLWEQEKKSPKN